MPKPTKARLTQPLVREKGSRRSLGQAGVQARIAKWKTLTSCRVGVVRQQETLQRLVNTKQLGSATHEIALLREMGQAMRDASICGLGQTASSALESALKRWSIFS